MTPMQRMADHATAGHLALQRCIDCGTSQYPPREFCAACLSDRLEWRATEAETGEVLATTMVHHSHEAAGRDLLPLRVGLVHLDLGSSIVCFVTDHCDAGTRVRVTARVDAKGRAVLTATAMP